VKGQLSDFEYAALALSVSLAVATSLTFIASITSSEPIQPLSVQDSDDGGSADKYPVMFESFEQGFSSSYLYIGNDADNPITNKEESLVSGATDGDTALNLTADTIATVSAIFIDGSHTFETPEVGDTVKFDIKPSTGYDGTGPVNSGMGLLFDYEEGDPQAGTPSNSTSYYVSYNESGDKDLVLKLWGVNTQNKVEYQDELNLGDRDPDKWYTVKAELNTDNTGENQHIATIYNSNGQELGSVNITVPDSYVDEGHDGYAFAVQNYPQQKLRYSLFDNARIVEGDN
jgi:hypothetical protein